MNAGHLIHILDIRMTNEAAMKEFVAVAELAKRCLELIGRERPTMKEVAAVLEDLRSSHGHPTFSQRNPSYAIAEPSSHSPHNSNGQNLKNNLVAFSGFEKKSHEALEVVYVLFCSLIK
ncbi:hypothetical protein HHK36_011718 [Tetracentron sinense]|uniref:Uncharacterized protein n=1 Tax=Tetracentron sinense TaxID=13715 RepID=A0A834Z8W3_TETSI|nr:hypothetical protein HHK36_011718 [Tetracentron sinense]